MEADNQTPLVSIIIPTYNRAWILKEAIESVLSQEGVEMELIVVDDGSTDDTEVLLASYGEDIRMIRQSNKGVSAARNRGVAVSQGKYIAFLDSDDLWLPDKLSTQIRFFKTHPDAVICQTEEIWIRNGVRVNPKKKHKKPSGRIFEPSLHLCLVSPSAVMMKRVFFEKMGGFDERFPVCEDYDLWLRISYKYPVYLINTPLIVKQGGHKDQLSKGWGLDKYRIQSILQLMARQVLSTAQHQAAVTVLKEKCNIYATGCRKRGRLEEALYYEELANQYNDR